jgi:hypothetical protein
MNGSGNNEPDKTAGGSDGIFDLLGAVSKETATGRTFGRKGGRKFGVYKPRTGGSGRIVRTWKPKKK